MTHGTEPADERPLGLEPEPQEWGRSNAVLFNQLAKFLVWGEQHRRTAVVQPEFERLLEETAEALRHAGSLAKESAA